MSERAPFEAANRISPVLLGSSPTLRLVLIVFFFDFGVAAHFGRLFQNSEGMLPTFFGWVHPAQAYFNEMNLEGVPLLANFTVQRLLVGVVLSLVLHLFFVRFIVHGNDGSIQGSGKVCFKLFCLAVGFDEGDVVVEHSMQLYKPSRTD